MILKIIYFSHFIPILDKLISFEGHSLYYYRIENQIPFLSKLIHKMEPRKHKNNEYLTWGTAEVIHWLKVRLNLPHLDFTLWQNRKIDGYQLQRLDHK